MLPIKLIGDITGVVLHWSVEDRVFQNGSKHKDIIFLKSITLMKKEN